MGSWGYIYLNQPVQEAQVAISVCKQYKPAFYLIDAESHAKGKFKQAGEFARTLRTGLPEMPIGMNSYWKPSYHPELPWRELRSICNFDTPQVYWRGGNPVGKTIISEKEYSLMKPKLPFWPAGEMYHEFGITTTPAELKAFLTYAKEHYPAAVLWSADANETTTELWKAFSEFEWNVTGAKLAKRLSKLVDDTKVYIDGNIKEILAGNITGAMLGESFAAGIDQIIKENAHG